MARRFADRAPTVERPRKKGWWGEPEDELLDDPVASERAVEPRQKSGRSARSAPVLVGRALTPSQIESIRAVMRLFVEDDLARGVDPRMTLLCHRCGVPRQAIGSVRYERTTLCHECCVEYEIARARGLVESAAEFVNRYAARSASA